MNPPKEDDATIDTATATTNLEPSSTTSDTSSLFPAAVVVIGQDSRRDNAESLVAAAARGNVEIIEDDDGPLLPPAMSAVPFDGDSPDLDAARTAASRYVGKPAKARPEVIQDNTGQDLPVSMMEFTDSKKMESIVARPPRPANIAEIGDEEDAWKKGQPPPRQEIAREDSIVIPPSEDMEGEVAQIITNRRGGRAEEFLLNANASPSNRGAHRNEDEEANVQNGNPEDTLAGPDLERDSMFKVPEAVLVEEVDDEVYMGTPVEPLALPLPWWKQRRMRFLLCLMFVVVAISAITSGLSLSSEGTDPIVIVVVASDAPSSSTAPSSSPTLTKSNSPSTSAFPSITTSPSSPPSIAPSSSVSPSTSAFPSITTSPSPPPSIAPSSSVSPSESPSSPPSLAPSSSVSPSTSPSSPPSIAPSSSVSPSTSPSPSMAPTPSPASPTKTCYWLTIATDYDEKPEETYWYLFRAVGGDWEGVKSHFASEGDTSYSESICLEKGEYSFGIYDDYAGARDGICCDHGEGSYNVTVDGTLIVEGGEFGWYEDSTFFLPFVAGTNETTQLN